MSTDDTPTTPDVTSDPVQQLIQLVRSGAVAAAFERTQVETITLKDGDFMHPDNDLVWAELGRYNTQFFIKHHRDMGGVSHIIIPNSMLPVLGALVERTTWAERGRIPPPGAGRRADPWVAGERVARPAERLAGRCAPGDAGACRYASGRYASALPLVETVELLAIRYQFDHILDPLFDQTSARMTPRGADDQRPV